MIKYLIPFLTLFLFLTGCGATSETSDNTVDPIQKEAPKSAHGIFTAGDDQTILEGSNALLFISILDTDKEFTEQVWKVGDKILSTSPELEVDLPVGEHHITLEAIDSEGIVYSDIITIVVKKEDEKNSPPSAKNIAFTTDEDSQFKTALSGSDVDGDELTYLLVSYPTHGKLRGSAANLYYTPNANYHGSDSFIYKTNDGVIDSKIATVSIMITSVNDSPTATAQTISLLEDSSKDVVLSGNDADNDSLTFTYTNPSHGTFDGTTYTPSQDYFGSDSFTFTANDGNLDSSPATVSIMIESVNDAPTFTSSFLETVNEDTLYTYNITTEDNDSDTVSLTLTTAPTWLTLSGSTLSGTPTNGDIGVHPIMITASDGSAQTTQAFSITVSNVNDTPIGAVDTVTTLEDTAILIDVLANDSDDDNDALSIATISQPLHGVAEIVGSKVLYTPKLNYHGTDSFTYQPQDTVTGNGTTVTVTVESVDDKAIFTSIPITQVVEGADYNYTIIASDVDDNITLIMGANTPDWLTLNNGILSGTAPYGQLDTTYAIQIIANAVDQNFTLTIKDVNFAPEFTNSAIMIDTDEDNNSIHGNFTATDSDGDNYYFITESNLTGFTLDLNGTFDLNLSDSSYQAQQKDENVSTTILIKVLDAAGASDEQNLTIIIRGIDDDIIINPITIEDSNLSNANGSITGTIIASDADDAVTFTDANTTNGFDINSSTGAYTFTPPAGAYDYLADGVSTTLTIPIMIGAVQQDIDITIIGKNDAPVLNELPPFSITEDVSLSGTFAATDADSDAILTFSSTGSLEGFTLENNGTFSFNPSHIMYQSLNVGDEITKSIPITVTDGILDANRTFMVQVIGQNDAPIAHYDYNQTNEDSNLSFNLLINDIDVDDNATLTLIDINATEGNFTFSPDGNLTFTPNGDYDYLTENEEHNITLIYMIEDEHSEASEANVTIFIHGINNAPTITAIDSITIDENVSTGIGQIVANDAENSSLTFESNSSLINIDSNGTYTFDTNGTYNTLAEGETEIIPIMITISDGVTNITQEINVTIVGVNTPPTVEIGADYNITKGDTLSLGITSSEDVDGSIIQYSWLIDGTEMSTTDSLEHNFTSEGIYFISLIVKDDKNATGSDTLTVTVNPASTGVSLFTPHTVTTNAISSEWLEMVDLDKDGDLDILSASTGNGGAEIAWYENRGDNNTFTEHIVTENANAPESIKAADMDNDGDLDILYTTYADGASLMQCINDGSEHFTCTAISNATNGLAYIETVDLDKDGKQDIITASWENNEIEWLKNSGQGNFTGAHMIDYQDTNNAISIHTSDFNKDGKVDVVAASKASNRIDWYAYDTAGAGNFEHHWVADINGVFSVNVADINNDGYDDIIGTSNSDGKVYWYKSTQSTSPTFGTALEIATLTNVYYATGVDMDNDGDIDILSASSKAGGKIAWYENIGEDSNFTEHIVASGLDNVIRVYPADIDNDGNMDVVAGYQNGNVIFYENDSTLNEKKLPKTGQTTVLVTGDDGDLQKGAVRSYEIIGENTMEHHTGLMWQDNSEVTSVTLRGDAIATYCGDKDGTYTDWRVPTIHELYYLADRGFSSPSIDTNYFLNAPNTHFWTSDLGIHNWRTYVDFDSSLEHYASENNNAILKNIRCVRGKPLEFKFIRDDSAEVVRDYVHKLMWQDDSAATSTADKTLAQAMTYCEELTLSSDTDWRVPNINELYSIFDTDTTFTAFHNTFKYRDYGTYWSTTAVPGSDTIITLGFAFGHDKVKSQDSNAKVRCVRDIP